MNKTLLNKIFLLSIITLLYNCKEPFEIEVLDFDSVLVVEGTLSNELKNQKISLSRTYKLDQTEPILELNATIWVEDSQSNTYTFEQNGEGVYMSTQSFQAIENITYKLFITTQDGKQYSSQDTTLTPVEALTDVYAELTTIDNSSGVQVMVDSQNPSGKGLYYRYEYDETYKIIAPSYFKNKLQIDNFEFVDGGVAYDTSFIPRAQNGRVCYTTKSSIGILQTSTNEFDENIISRFPVRFIKSDNSILQERYTINVRQYVQSLEAYTFYRIINELGSIQSLLSQNQPGYVAGNINALNDPDEKVLGFFEVSSVSSKRIYFNHSDFQLSKPPYFYECFTVALDYNDNTTEDRDLNERQAIYSFQRNSNMILGDYGSPIFTLVNRECGDCTAFSSNIRPDFWED